MGLVLLLYASMAQADKCGTAFPINGNGYFVTAGHVLSGAQKIFVFTKQQGIVQATSYTINKANDVGFFFVPKYKSQYLLLSNNPGPYGLGIYGYPRPDIYGTNLKMYLGTGYKTSFSLLLLRPAIIINANIWPGNSGGPIISDKGTVVGLVTDGLLPSDLPNDGSTQGLGTPTNKVTQLLDRHQVLYFVVDDSKFSKIDFGMWKGMVEQKDLSVMVCVTEK